MLRPEDVKGDGNCFYHAAVRSGLFPVIDHLLLWEAITMFALGAGRVPAEKIVQLLHEVRSNRPHSFTDVICIGRPRSFDGNIDMVLTSLNFNVEVIAY